MVGPPSNPSISYIISPTVEQETRTAKKYSRLQQMQFVEFKKKRKKKKKLMIERDNNSKNYH